MKRKRFSVRDNSVSLKGNSARRARRGRDLLLRTIMRFQKELTREECEEEESGGPGEEREYEGAREERRG